MLPSHLFISSVCGDMHDTRRADWSRVAPLRANYSRTYAEIENTAELRATLRAGDFTWPGLYPLYFITRDGAALSFDTVRAELRNVLSAIATGSNDGWQVVACTVNWEDPELICEHSGKHIPSAYAGAD